MLKEIICDKFISHGKERGPIIFHSGLNIVQGHNTGTNSIGKSTFLLVVDFVFGGSTYAKDKQIIKKIGHHTIKFKFVFNDNEYYFSRTTAKPKVVNICDNVYNIKETISLEEYTNRLFDLYTIDLENITFRKVVGLFFRIYGRDNADEKAALSSHKGEGQEEALIDFLKLFKRYNSVIVQLYEDISKKTAEKKGYKTVSQYEFTKLITNKKEYDENLVKINEYKLKLDNFNKVATEEMLNKDSDELKMAAEYKATLDVLYRKKKFLWKKYYSIKEKSDEKRPCTTQDFENLKTFFPNCNIKLLSEIEKFHSNLSIILDSEFKEAMSNLLKEINMIASEIDKIEKTMVDLDLPIKISRKTLDDFAEIRNQCRILEKENELFDENKKRQEDIKIMKKNYENLFLEQSDIICELLNEKINSLNSYIYGDEVESPKLEILKSNSYKFGIENDDGTGTNNKNMILLDLAALTLTSLPCVAHDTIIFKHIGQFPMSKILELYNGYAKQIFIAIDETIKYPSNAQNIIKDNTILELSGNGNELYGSSWVKRKTDKTEKK